MTVKHERPVVLETYTSLQLHTTRFSQRVSSCVAWHSSEQHGIAHFMHLYLPQYPHTLQNTRGGRRDGGAAAVRYVGPAASAIPCAPSATCGRLRSGSTYGALDERRQVLAVEERVADLHVARLAAACARAPVLLVRDGLARDAARLGRAPGRVLLVLERARLFGIVRALVSVVSGACAVRRYMGRTSRSSRCRRVRFATRSGSMPLPDAAACSCWRVAALMSTYRVRFY
jgi:hypothetical protein